MTQAQIKDYERLKAKEERERSYNRNYMREYMRARRAAQRMQNQATATSTDSE
jgi:hypothetical protein